MRFVNDFIKATNTPYNVYNHLLNFELDCFNIDLISFINFLNFYGIESLTIVTITILKAETTKNVLNNKNVVRIIGYGRRKREKKRSVNLFVIIIVIGLDNIYFAKFLIYFLFIFILRFVVTAFFFIVATFTLFVAVLFV